MRKEFSKKLNDDNDPISRAVVLNYFKTKYNNTNFIENPNKYKIDLIDINRKIGIEIGKLNTWISGYIYPYPNYTLFERKCHFFNGSDNDGYNNLLIILNKNMSKGIVAMGSDINKYLTTNNCKLINNCSDGEYNTRKEYVYFIPLNIFNYIDF